jgi:hypothetical protein
MASATGLGAIDSDRQATVWYGTGSVMVQKDVAYRVFSSFEEEAEAECLRRSEQSPEDRINEFAILQERCWGEKWTSQKMVPVVSFERVRW